MLLSVAVDLMLDSADEGTADEVGTALQEAESAQDRLTKFLES